MTAQRNEFLKWDHASGQVVPGLTRRRSAERCLFPELICCAIFAHRGTAIPHSRK
ncbi:glycoside hydrolase family protein [Salmonella enterica]|uniref:glycoside hydrolase family protein n=1 Tax=Salmonella enterica TaxID=28901 RepID=UPI0039EFC2AD